MSICSWIQNLGKSTETLILQRSVLHKELQYFHLVLPKALDLYCIFFYFLECLV